VKYDLPITVVIIKNNTLGMIKWEQMVFLGNPEYGVELQPIDFVRFAEACGGVGFRCERPEEVQPALEAALRARRPAQAERRPRDERECARDRRADAGRRPVEPARRRGRLGDRP
jgi:thiamine pyrophosphate-dependent acetolactate synthase large subunit-like protein